ncbi:MAG: DNA-processing protein DprA [Phycisphaerales bacterium]|nr:DNA-processing protein DprA [Phycisphaerales bacterium]
MPLKHWMQLALAEGVGAVLRRRIVEKAGCVEAACEAPRSLLATVEGIGPAGAARIAQAIQTAAERAERELIRASAAGVRVVCTEDEDFPALLREIPDPPAVLYFRGSLQPRDLHSIAIVGSRKCSVYGREQAERFGALLAGAGLTVVSGGARGVDSAAHRGAMRPENGRTIAVLGCGVDIAYPPENAPLFEQITARGAILSEHPLGTPPVAENFPRRNRLISGLARGVLVIEADLRSGALITARQAGEEQGRAVFALPGRVDNPNSAGPHRLIREGATLVSSLEDILENLGPLPQSVHEPALFDAPTGADASPEQCPSSLTESQQKLVDALVSEELDANGIIEATGLPAATVLRELTLLTLRGVIRKVDSTRYARRA